MEGQFGQAPDVHRANGSAKTNAEMYPIAYVALFSSVCHKNSNVYYSCRHKVKSRSDKMK